MFHRTQFGKYYLKIIFENLAYFKIKGQVLIVDVYPLIFNILNIVKN